MKKRKYIFIVPVFLCIVLSYCFYNSNSNQNKRKKIVVFLHQKEINRILKTGDVICRKGNGIWSDMFCELSQRDKRYSHVGIIINEPGKDITVLHADANNYTGIGIVEEISLVDFLLCGDGAGVYRLRLANQSLEDTPGFINLARKYLKRAFDFKFDINDSQKLYCTEYLFHVFSELKPSVALKVVKKGDKAFIPVDSCNDPMLFTEIMMFPNFHKDLDEMVN